MKARQEAADDDEHGLDVCAVVQIFPGSMDSAQRSAFASSLRARGLLPWMQRQAQPGMPQPSAQMMLAQAEADRLMIAEQHGEIPVILFGHGYGATLASALIRRLPKHFAGAAFWNMNFIPPLTRTVLLARLRWEKFRLGSDVPSRVLRSSPLAPPTIGLAIAALQLGRMISPGSLDALARTLPILILADDSVGGSRLSIPETSTWRRNPTLDLNSLNQDMNKILADWAVDIVQRRGAGDQVA